MIVLSGASLVLPDRVLSPGTLVIGSVGEPVVFAFVNRQLVAVLVLTVRDNLILKIEATVDPSAASGR